MYISYVYIHIYIHIYKHTHLTIYIIHHIHIYWTGYMYMSYVCIHIHIHIYKHTHLTMYIIHHVHIYWTGYTNISYLYIYTYLHIRISLYICILIWHDICVYHIHVYIHMYIRIWICICIRIWICIHILIWHDIWYIMHTHKQAIIPVCNSFVLFGFVTMIYATVGVHLFADAPGQDGHFERWVFHIFAPAPHIPAKVTHIRTKEPLIFSIAYFRTGAYMARIWVFAQKSKSDLYSHKRALYSRKSTVSSCHRAPYFRMGLQHHVCICIYMYTYIYIYT